MSTREKQLLTILLLAGFFIVNLLLYSIYTKKITQARNNLDLSKINLQQAITVQENSGQLAQQMEWLNQNQPEPSNYQTVQSQLLDFADSQAVNLGLTVKSRNFLETDTSGIHYHRAQVKINVSGQEQALYSWLHTINDPSLFRSAYQIRLTPNSQDDKLIDCSATIAQWFPPIL